MLQLIVIVQQTVDAILPLVVEVQQPVEAILPPVVEVQQPVDANLPICKSAPYSGRTVAFVYLKVEDKAHIRKGYL